jgi:hypothetical protein
MRTHLTYRFEELIWIDEQVYMALRVIKQNKDEKVEVYCERILKTNKLFST